MAEPDHAPSKPDSDSAKLVHGSIAGHIFRQTYPVVFGVAAIMSIGIIDAYFVGNLGPDNLAAISFIFPVTTALSSLGEAQDRIGRAEELGFTDVVVHWPRPEPPYQADVGVLEALAGARS